MPFSKKGFKLKNHLVMAPMTRSRNAALNIPDLSSAYTPGAKGYTDYPTLAGSKEKALLVGSY